MKIFVLKSTVSYSGNHLRLYHLGKTSSNNIRLIVEYQMSCLVGVRNNNKVIYGKLLKI